MSLRASESKGIDQDTSARGNRVFISHSTIDKHVVEEIEQLLTAGIGLNRSAVFCSSLPGSGVSPGDSITKLLNDEIRSTKLVIFVLTPSFYESAFALCELGAVWGMNKRFIPILIPPLNVAEVKGVISGSLVIKANVDSDLDVFRDHVNKILGNKNGNTAHWNLQKKLFIHNLKSIATKKRDMRTTKEYYLTTTLKVELSRIRDVILGMRRKFEGSYSIWLTMFDIDKLTQINTEFGVETGDILLDIAYNILGSMKKDIIDFGRCGDDTFFALMLNDRTRAINISNKIVRKYKLEAGRALYLRHKVAASSTISVGIVDYMSVHDKKSMQAAFFACHKAKEEGGDRLLVASGKHLRDWS